MPTTNEELERELDHFKELSAYYAYRLLTGNDRYPWAVLSAREKGIWVSAVSQDDALQEEVTESKREERRQDILCKLKELGA
jgi:hypothetical protein